MDPLIVQRESYIIDSIQQNNGGGMHVCKLSDLFSDEEIGFVFEALEAALGEAEEVLERHKSEEPPLFEVQTTSEAAENYVNLIASQQRRIQALKDAMSLCERG
jgi:hypothetical protein